MFDKVKGDLIGNSLDNQEICYVVATKYESPDNLQSELATTRKNFYLNNKKKQIIKSKEPYMGYPASLNILISENSFKYNKILNESIVAETKKYGKTFITTLKDKNGKVTSAITYDNRIAWIKTEYFTDFDSDVATLILKPSTTESCLEVYCYNKTSKTYNSESYYPVIFELESDELNRSIEIFGNPEIYIQFTNYIAIYCNKEEAKKRIAELSDKPKNLLEEELEDDITEDSKEVEINEDDLILEVEKCENIAPDTDIENLYVVRESTENLLMEESENLNYTGSLYAGAPEGRGRTETKNGEIVFDGQFKQGTKNGFGVHYNKNSEIQYVGNWENDKKHGFGVSFRDTDKSIHISKWENGKPQEDVCLINSNLNLKYLGKIINGKKEGVAIKECDEGFIILKYNNGIQNATIFDKNGNLLYNGEYKDDMRNGNGTAFDLDGNIIYKGLFENNQYAEGMLYQKINKD